MRFVVEAKQPQNKTVQSTSQRKRGKENRGGVISNKPRKEDEDKASQATTCQHDSSHQLGKKLQRYQKRHHAPLVSLGVASESPSAEGARQQIGGLNNPAQ